MSELTQCNFCTLEQLKREAKKKRHVVTCRRGWRGGIDVYVHPLGATLPPKSATPSESEYWRHWFQRVTDHCVC